MTDDFQGKAKINTRLMLRNLQIGKGRIKKTEKIREERGGKGRETGGGRGREKAKINTMVM